MITNYRVGKQLNNHRSFPRSRKSGLDVLDELPAIFLGGVSLRNLTQLIH